MADPVPTPLQQVQARLPSAISAATAPNQNSTQRLVAFVVVLLLPFLNALLGKAGLSVSETQLETIMGVGVVYIVQSVGNAIHARNVAAAQAKAPTPAAAVADLNSRGPNP